MSDEKPHQERDFVLDKSGKMAYIGPLFRVTYPPCNRSIATLAWKERGYRTRVATDCRGGDNLTLMVAGDIPEHVNARLEKLGIEVTLAKERGKAISLDTFEEVDV